MCRTLFPSQQTADTALSALGKRICIHTNDLNIVAAPKGIVTGPITYVGEHVDQVDLALFGPQGNLIPPRPERLRDLKCHAHLILA